MSVTAQHEADIRLTEVRVSSSDSRSAFYARAAALVFFLFTRVAFGLLAVLTSVYCLLVYIPFSYYGFIHDPILWWLPSFVKFHAYLYGITLLAIAAALIPELRRPKTRASAGGFLLMNAVACFYLMSFSPLRRLGLNVDAYVWGIVGLFPVIWLGAIDAVSAGQSTERRQSILVAPRSADLANAGFAAITVWLAFAVVSIIRNIAGPPQLLSPKARLFGILFSLGAHVGIFVIVATLVLMFRQLSARFRSSDLVYSSLTRLLAWTLCALAVLKIALPSLSFTGPRAIGFAAAVGLTLVVSFEGTISKVKAQVPEVVRRVGGATAWTWSVAAASLLLLAYAIPSVIAKTDWDFVLQKFAVLLLWALAFLALGKSNVARENARLLAAGLAVVITGVTVFAFYDLGSTVSDRSSWNNLVEAYAGADISFKTAADILSRSLDNSSHENSYQFLRQHTNISAEVAARPAAVQLVSQSVPRSAKKPNIFIFVIDSLRQDYVPQYAASATFTPAIASFVSESVEFKKAFTRYAGTALSEPAIWVGAMQVHKQYIQPFYPMNNLEELLQSEGYDSFVSVDPILSLLFSPSFPTHRLSEQTKRWSELDLVPTLTEIEQKMDARTDKTKPVFVYTQPQNIHTVTLEETKHGNSRREMSIYELKRIDGAFGEFVQFLKARDLYENSLVVLTSDHGDSYGEFGRYGHSDFLFPEVIQIPLIIHLPSEMRREMVCNPEDVAFSLDITPTIYYLLGHRPILNNELLGRPLFTATEAERQAYSRKDYLLASSYAPVYGILSKDGDSLFIEDAVNRRSYFFDLGHDPLGTRNEISARRWNEGDREVRRQLLQIDQAYGIHFAD